MKHSAVMAIMNKTLAQDYQKMLEFPIKKEIRVVFELLTTLNQPLSGLISNPKVA
jgi:hypothetical protein